MAAAAFGSALAVLLATDGVHPWVLADYGIDYASHGFVGRGLVGTLVSPFVHDASDVMPVLALTSLLAAVALAALLLRLGRQLPDDAQRDTLVVVAVPLFAQLGHEFGRQDGLVVAAVALLVLALREERRHVAAAAIVAGGLVHEAALLHAALVLVVAALCRTASRRILLQLAGVTGLLGLVLLTAGRFEGSEQQFLDRLPPGVPQDFGPLISRADPLTGSFGDGIAHVEAYLSTSTGQLGLVLLVLVVGTAAWFLARHLSAAVAVASVVPVAALALVGIDYLRWAFLHVAVTLLLLVMVERVPRIDRAAVVPAVLVLLVLGPFGGAAPLPYWL